MKVLIPTPLRSYTANASWVEAEGATLDALVNDLDRKYPGIRFRMINEQGRMRPHVRFFVNAVAVHDMALPLAATDEVCIVQALSGG
jgi:molybdopterin converting factor small subunit